MSSNTHTAVISKEGLRQALDTLYDKGLSRRQIALRLGMDPSTITKYCNGDMPIRNPFAVLIGLLLYLVDTLGVDPTFALDKALDACAGVQ